MSDFDSERTDESNPSCRGSSRQERTTDATGRWISTDSVLDADLPDDLRTGLGDLLGERSVETLGDWIEAIRRVTGGGSIAVDDLCHSEAETGHWGEMDGERYHFLCFYDAVILAALSDRPVDVRTESPGGETIEARAAGTADLTVVPADAVFSFGVDDGVEPPADGEPSPADVYGAVCPYVRAFPDPDAYEVWAESVSAATVATSLEGATELAAALVE